MQLRRFAQISDNIINAGPSETKFKKYDQSYLVLVDVPSVRVFDVDKVWLCVPDMQVITGRMLYE